MPYNQSAGRRAHLRACYLDPRVDIDKIPWNLLCRPTPFVGYAPAPGAQQDGQFNAAQLRDAREVALPKPADVYRIFITGGSFAYGFGAPGNAATIAAFLERELNHDSPWPGKRVEVWNAAVCAWTSTHERLWIETHLLSLQPDMIIEINGVNDAHWGYDGFNVFNVRTYEEGMYLNVMQSAMRMAGVPPFSDNPPVRRASPLDPAEVARNYMQNTAQTAALLQSRHVEYVLALQPFMSPELKPLTKEERAWIETQEPQKFPYIDRCVKGIKAMLARSGDVLSPPPGSLRVVELQDVFAKRHDAIYLDMYHVGDKGNQLMAVRLAKELRGPKKR